MDSRDLIIIGVVGIAAWLGYRYFFAGTPQPIATGNPAAGSAMVAGAAAQTQTGAGATRGLFVGGTNLSPILGSPFGIANNFQNAAGQLLALNVIPQPVASVPVTLSSPTAGIAPTGGTLPPPQRLNPTINPTPITWRGFV